ncbi:hypothetical protein HCG51_27915 [Tolypothrix sp. PCC 7910]|uniref:hypothetical protein n=1 Tax=Tolypothrix sp. PCC 7910 TaxID=2099387 RepID=UPI0014278D30|nr:hypothetical protein [Tolypothrix sp. PCC 7910]QIR40160.1 hypothetical protein HCG51_27915 [Tolypothrix sp. PCC 7910]
MVTLTDFQQLIAQQRLCSNTLPKALQALFYDKKGDWDKAHEIVQNASDNDSAWVHAYLHRKEGDLSNARYWYRRSNQPDFTGDLNQEWEEIAASLLKNVSTFG